MKRAEFVKAVAKQNGISSRQAYRAVNSVLDTLRVLLSDREEIEIGGFWTFEVLTDLRGNRTPFFRSGKALKRVLNTPVETEEQED
jgi:nucleoid DNA-binding protein